MSSGETKATEIKFEMTQAITNARGADFMWHVAESGELSIISHLKHQPVQRKICLAITVDFPTTSLSMYCTNPQMTSFSQSVALKE